MKNRMITLTLIFTLGLLLLPQNVVAATIPPQPEFIPPELIVTPGSQNIGLQPGGRAVWTVTLEGGSGGYYVTVTWGDSCGSYISSGWYPGETRQIQHDFNCGYNTIYYQTWKLEGAGGPVYEYTTVVRY